MVAGWGSRWCSSGDGDVWDGGARLGMGRGWVGGEEGTIKLVFYCFSIFNSFVTFFVFYFSSTIILIPCFSHSLWKKIHS